MFYKVPEFLHDEERYAIKQRNSFHPRFILQRSLIPSTIFLPLLLPSSRLDGN